MLLTLECIEGGGGKNGGRLGLAESRQPHSHGIVDQGREQILGGLLLEKGGVGWQLVGAELGKETGRQRLLGILLEGGELSLLLLEGSQQLGLLLELGGSGRIAVPAGQRASARAQGLDRKSTEKLLINIGGGGLLLWNLCIALGR